MRTRENPSAIVGRKLGGRVIDLIRAWVKEVPFGALRAGLSLGWMGGRQQGWGKARLLRGLEGAGVPQRRRRQWVRGGVGAANLDPLEAKVLLSAVIATDRQDYAFGSTAYITGSGFAANEVVQLQVVHAAGTGGSNGNPQNVPWDVTADASGNLNATWAVTEPDAVGATFDLTAVGLTSGETAETEFTDGIGGPTNLGTAGNLTSATTINSSNLSSAVGTGNTMFVTVAMDPNSGSVSVTDTSGNTYTKDADVTNGSVTTGVRTLVFSAPVTTALTTGSHITVTFGTTTTAKAVDVFYASGLFTSSPEDQTAGATGSGSSPNSGKTATTIQGTELLIGAVGNELGSNGLNSWGSGWTAVAGSTNSGGSSTGVTLNTASQKVTVKGTYGVTANLLNSANWAAAIVTYKAQLPTPAFSNLSVSSSIAYGTSSVALSGTLGAGVSPVPDGETVTATINGVAVNGTISGGAGAFVISYPTAALPASTTPYTITYGYAGDGTFAPASDSSTTLTVNQATPGISWSNPADIVYGTALDGTQLDATTTVSGGIDYTPDFGTVLNAGAGQTLTAQFTPSDSTDYTGAAAQATINVWAAATAVSVDDGAASVGDPTVTLVAHVADTQTAAVVNEGTVTFTVMQGETVIGTVDTSAVLDGVATDAFSLAGVGQGDYSVTATYNPAPEDANFNGSSTVAAATLAVNPAGTAFENLSTSQVVMNGVTSVALSGTLMAGSVPAPDGETVAVVIDGIEQDTVTAGGNGSFAMEFDISGIPVSATPYAIGYSFAGDENFAPASDSSTTLTVSGPPTNQAPVNLLPGTQSLVEDGSLIFSVSGGNAISISDTDSGGNTEQVTLSVNHGVLTLSGTAGLSFEFNDVNGTGAGEGMADGTMTFRGTVAAINAALDGMTYTPAAGYSGADTLAIATNDLGNTGGGALTDSDSLMLDIQAVPAVTSINGAGNSPTNESAVSWTVTFSGPVVAGADNPTSLFSENEPGAPIAANDGSPIELGMPFVSSVGGMVTGVRFFKNSSDTGVHVGKLYDPANPEVPLATVTFSNETATGWQEADFSTPVVIAAGKTYIVSYYSSAGYYDATVGYFGNGPATNGALKATEGAYVYGDGGGYPSNPSTANYWVDVVFKSTAGSSLWADGPSGTASAYSEAKPIELGTQFVSSKNGIVTGVAFYKNAADTGTHIGNLYDPANPDVPLATVTFSSETASGWQEADFSTPVAIAAGKTYVISYYTSDGFYEATPDYLALPDTNGALMATGGAYSYGEGGYPATSTTANYWVEPVFNSATPIADDFQLTGAGAAGAAILGVDTGDGTAWTVTAATGGDGALGLNLVDNDSIIDAKSRIPLGGVGTGGGSDGSFIGEQYLVDKTAPVAGDDALLVLENGTLTLDAPGVLSNDTDLEPAAELTVNLLSGPAHGELTLNADGSLVYVPTANYSGADAFTYTVTDGAGNTSSPANVNITVNPIPVVDTVSIMPGAPGTDDTLTAQVSAHDDNGDTPALAYQWYKDGDAIEGATGATLDLSVAGNGDKGDEITVQVTPADGEMAGATVASDAVTIGDTAPVIDSVSIAPADPLTNDVLTADVSGHDVDGDGIDYSFEWYLNGVAIDGATTATLDLSAAGNKGDVVTVQVTPGDGSLTGAPVTSTAVTIGDSAPVIDSVSIAPANALTNDILSANVTSHDMDGDAVAYAYQWFKGDVAIAGATASTLDLSGTGNGDKGDTITVQVTPNDGEMDGVPVASDAVVIGDKAPTVDSVTISPANPLSQDVLNANVASHDTDGDAVGYAYQWFVNGTAIDGATQSSFDLTMIASKGDQITVQVTPSDGELSGTAVVSDAVTVGDTAPVIDSVSITPAGPQTNDLLTANVTSHDVDQDALTYSYQWFKGGVAIAGATGSTLDLSPAGNGDRGDAISVQVTPTDGTLAGGAVMSAAVTIGDTAPVVGSVSISPANPLTNDVLTANVSAQDADGDAVTYAYQWFLNGSAIDGATGATLDLSVAGNGDKGDGISVQVTPNDGAMDGVAVTSDAVTVGDTASVIDSVAITPANPLTSDMLTANVTGHDADVDTVSYAYQWYKNGNPIAGATGATLDLSVAGNGEKGDAIAVQVTPDDGTQDGMPVTSAAVTIGDTAPAIDSVSIMPGNPLTNDVLTAQATSHDIDGDAVTYSYQWFLNGGAIEGATGASLDLSSVGDRGDRISVQVTPGDGEMNGAAVTSAAVTVGDTAPVIDSVSITPASPFTNELLTANLTSHDADADTVAYSYQWFKNGDAIDGATAATLDLSLAGNGDKGDEITVQVTPNDGELEGTAVTSDAVTVGDTAPAIDSVSITPGNPLTNDILTAQTTSHDIDGDAVTYSYQWFKNGVAIEGATSVTLDLSVSGNGDKGDAITVQVTPDDGEQGGVAVSSMAVTIGDTAPVIDSVSVTPANPLTDDILSANVASYDVDSDTVTYSYRWFVNGTAIEGATGATLDLSVAGNGDKGDGISVQVTPNDGAMDGVAVASDAVTVGDTAPVIDSVTITPATPLATDILTAGVASHDVDGDTVTYNYQWYKNGDAIDGATSATFDTSALGNGSVDDQITVQVTPSDGESGGNSVISAAVTIADSAPVIDSVSIMPSNPIVGDEVTANVTSHDIDGDTVTYAYQWYINGGAISGATTGMLDLSAVGAMPTDEISVTVTPSDGTLNGTAVSADTTVNPAALALSGLADQAGAEGDAIDLVLGSVSNPGWAENIYSVSIDWGDGTTSTFDQSDAGSLGTFSKTYADNGNYTVSITVEDAHGAMTTGSFTAQIANVAPVLSLSGNDLTRAGAPYTLTLSSSDPGDDSVSSWTINWGDGSPTQTIPAAARSFNAATGQWETSTQVTHTFLTGPANYTVSATATDDDGTYNTGNTLGVTVEHATVAARELYYANSYFSAGGDDAAIAIDKVALLPGQTASFANYSSYSKGINGIMVDLAGTFGTVAADDFVVRVGNDNDPSGWADGPAPTVTVVPGAGVNGSARIKLTWADDAIANEWVQITVVANLDTGLAANDVFYFGNAIGDSGDSATDAMVTATDEDGARDHPANLVLNPASITNAYDYNRDGKVNVVDQIIARVNATTAGTALQLISLGGFSLTPASDNAPAVGNSAPPTTPANSGNGPDTSSFLPAASLGVVTTTPAGPVSTPLVQTLTPLMPAAPTPPVPTVIITGPVKPAASQREKRIGQAPQPLASKGHASLSLVKRRTAGNLLAGFENLWNWLFYKG